MRALTARSSRIPPVVCPRCAAPITEEYRFCPACAFRLQSSPGDGFEPVVSPRGRFGGMLLLGGAIVVTAGLLTLGWVLFDRDRAPPASPHRGPLSNAVTVRPLGDGPSLRDTMVSLPRSAVYAGFEVPTPVAAMRFMRYETTRGQWREFLDDVTEHKDRIPAYLREKVWTGPVASNYLEEWWSKAERHLERNGTPVTRPVWLRLDAEGRITEEVGLLLLAPPSWVRLTAYEIEWDMPTRVESRPENLPITGISWIDATAFAQWASNALDLSGDDALRLPSPFEWQRAAQGSDPNARWPWGSERLRYACNSLTYWEGPDAARPLPVDFTYSDAPGTTSDGLCAMAGNVAEWLWPFEPAHREGMPFAPDERFPWAGGSYLSGLEDCTVDSRTNGRQYERFEDVGFRLMQRGE